MTFFSSENRNIITQSQICQITFIALNDLYRVSGFITIFRMNQFSCGNNNNFYFFAFTVNNEMSDEFIAGEMISLY